MTIPDTLTLDTYYNNTIPSFQQARDAGLRAVIHKCSEGLSFTDPLYASRKIEVTGLGMMWGAYHFIHAGDPVLQADRFLRLVGNDPSTLLCVDLERDLQGHIAPLTDVEVFVQHIKERTGRYPCVYTAKWVMDIINPTVRPSIIYDCPLWVASYNDVPTLPAGWNTWTLWQWTNGAVGPLPHSLPGLGHNDLSSYNGSLDQLKQWWGSGVSPIPPTPPNGGDLQVELMTTTATVNVRTSPRIPPANNNIAYELPANTPVKMITDNVVVANGYHWLERFTYRGLWIAREFLKSAVPPVLNQSKIGAHLSQFAYDKTAFIAMLKQMRAAGKPLGWLLVLGPQELPVSQIKAASPETKIIMRVYRASDGGPDMDAATFFATQITGDRNQADYYQINNEWNDFSEAAINWWIAQCQWANAHGKKLVCPIWATGNPGDLNIWKQPYIQNFLRFLQATGNILALHEYYLFNENWTLFRLVDHVLPLLPRDIQLNMPDTVFPEWGQEKLSQLSKDGTLSIFRTWNTRLLLYPWIKGVMVWALGNSGGWDLDNFSANMDVLTQV